MDHQIAGARQGVGVAGRVGQRLVARRVHVAVQHEDHGKWPFTLWHIHKAVDLQAIAGITDQVAGESVGDVQYFLDLQLALAVSSGGEAVNRELDKWIGGGRRGGGGVAVAVGVAVGVSVGRLVGVWVGVLVGVGAMGGGKVGVVLAASSPVPPPRAGVCSLPAQADKSTARPKITPNSRMRGFR